MFLFFLILLLNDKRVISKERKTVRASKFIRAPDKPGQIIRAKLAMNKFKWNEWQSRKKEKNGIKIFFLTRLYIF